MGTSVMSLNKIPNAWVGPSPPELLHRGAPEVPQIIKAVATAVSCMSDPITEDTPCFDFGHGEVKLGLNWKVVSCQLAFIVPEGAMQAVGEQSPTFLLGYELCFKILTHKMTCACLCSSGLAVVGKTDILLIGSKAGSTKQG